MMVDVYGSVDFDFLLSIPGACGSCYSFSSMGMLESRVRILTNNTETPIFSPQQVVSCSQYSQGNTCAQTSCKVKV